VIALMSDLILVRWHDGAAALTGWGWFTLIAICVRLDPRRGRAK